MQSGFELPEPAPEALAHSRRLIGLISERIQAAGGWIDFGEYMDLALYAPGLGYYSAGAVKFGAAGDFVTAPEISPLFARCLARACGEILKRCANGVILELGGGTGSLAAQLLTALARGGAQPPPYLLLELSADLRHRQRETIQRIAREHLAGVHWLERMPAEGLEGVILANEVADALPVSRFTIRSGVPWALGVSQSAAQFRWSAQPASRAVTEAVGGIQRLLPEPLAEGYTSELNPRLPAWIATLADALARGVLLISDYGLSRREYYHSQRRGGTLICHYRHRAHEDPFRYPGLQDITAWVDFTAVAEAATAAGCRVAGYTTQAHFLLANGIGEELSAEAQPGATSALVAARRARTLLLPGEMGERFKVMALTRGADIAVPGFSIRDLRHLL